MNEEIKNLINEMKEVVMELHRSAGNLDECIQGMERSLSEMDADDKDEIRFTMRFFRKSRLDSEYVHKYDILVAREYDIWNRLLNTTK